MAEQVSGGGREGFNRLRRQNEEEGSEVPKSFRWRRKISEGLIHWGRRGCRASAPFMHREGASLPCPLCNSLPLSAPFHKPWKQFRLPREPLLLDLLHSLGKESTGNTCSYSWWCDHWWEPCGCQSCPLQASKLPLAATTAASSDGGDSLCMLPTHPLLLSSLTTRAGGLQPVTTT